MSSDVKPSVPARSRPTTRRCSRRPRPPHHGLVLRQRQAPRAARGMPLRAPPRRRVSERGFVSIVRSSGRAYVAVPPDRVPPLCRVCSLTGSAAGADRRGGRRPDAFGALTGYLLGVNEIAYIVLAGLGILGGYLAGMEHKGAGEGALRGLGGGLLFGGSILLVHEATGDEPKAAPAPTRSHPARHHHRHRRDHGRARRPASASQRGEGRRGRKEEGPASTSSGCTGRSSSASSARRSCVRVAVPAVVRHELRTSAERATPEGCNPNSVYPRRARRVQRVRDLQRSSTGCCSRRASRRSSSPTSSPAGTSSPGGRARSR